MPIYDKEEHILYTDATNQLEWQPFVVEEGGQLYFEMDNNDDSKNKLEIKSFADYQEACKAHKIKIKSLKRLLIKGVIVSLEELSKDELFVNEDEIIKAKTFKPLITYCGFDYNEMRYYKLENNIKNLKAYQDTLNGLVGNPPKRGVINLEDYLNPNHAVLDHKKKEFPNVKKLVSFWGEPKGITLQMFQLRLKRGWSLKKALTTTPKKPYVLDHLGNKYPNLYAMTKAYGVLHNTYYYRKRRGWSTEKALTLQAYKGVTAKEVVDHEGNVYPSLAEMCQHYGITQTAYYYRINHGYPLKDVLLGKPK